MTPPDVSAWLAAQEPETREAIQSLRDIVLAVDAPWIETVKWNAPSFAIGGEDRVTLGIERRGGWRVVLHRGAAVRNDGFHFPDPDRLARWPSPDRGVICFGARAEIEAAAPRLADMVRRWIAAA